MEHLRLLIRLFTLGAAGIFLTGMLFGFSSGPGRRGWRLVLLASILLCISAAIDSAWNVAEPAAAVAFSGMVAVTVACGLFVWSLRGHAQKPGKAFATSPPPVLVRRGTYRAARHPIYLSYILALAGTALLAHSWLVAGLTIWMASLYWFAARIEERTILESPFAEDYAEYMREVGMFGPRLMDRSRRPIAAASAKGRVGEKSLPRN